MSETFADDPVLASTLGVPGYDAQLGDLSEQAFERRERSVRRWSQRLAELGWALPIVSPGPGRDRTGSHTGAPRGAEVADEARVDATLLASHLAGQEVMGEWQYWRRDPETYLGPCSTGVASLFLHRLQPEPQLVEAAVSRLAQVRGVLEAARRQLDPEMASSVLLERGVSAARGCAEYFREALPAEVEGSRLREQLAAAAEEAAGALGRFADYLCGLAARASGSWAIGEDRYTALLGRRELLELSAGELSAVGERAWEDLDEEMTRLARTVDAGAPGWRAVMAALSADHPSSPEELLSAYRAACDRARAFLVEHDLVTLPEGEQCSVDAAPQFLRVVLAVASYEPPPMFAEAAHGHFMVPFPPSGAPRESVEQLLADNCWSCVPTVAVHEAYPGHHWQLTWSKRTGRPLRKVLTTSYFVEGWALYAEAMMRRQGFFTSPGEELAHLDARIFRAARVVVDTALHSGQMSFDEAVGYMMERTSLGPTVARAEVSRYCTYPTQAASYWVGAAYLDRVCSRWLGDNRGTLRELHDKVAASPGLPLPLVGWELFGTV